MASVHLVIVGTSVLRNALRELSGPLASKCTHGEKARYCAALVAACADPQRLDETRCAQLEKDTECLKLISCLVENDPYRMSAELNAMDWVIGSNCSGVEKIILYATDTHAGVSAAKILENTLSKLCSNVEIQIKRIPGLAKEFWPGILGLIERVAMDAREERLKNKIIYLNATGGFKPEAGVALLAAMLAAPVAPYYKHEAMKQTVMLPAVPLKLDSGRARVIIGQLELIAEPGKQIRIDDPEYAEINWLLQYMAMNKLLIDKGRGYYEVTEKAAEILSILASYYNRLVMVSPRP